MAHIELNGTWKLGYFDPGDGLKEGAHLPAYDDIAWVSVAVPGEVHVALRDAGVIEDPFYDRNAEKCRWMENREFWYRRSFDLPDAPPDEKTRYILRFHGLDTYATVYLNGEEIGEHHNMFTVAEFDVTDRLHYDGINYLAVRFDPPDIVLADKSLPEDWWSSYHHKRVWMRKAMGGIGGRGCQRSVSGKRSSCCATRRRASNRCSSAPYPSRQSRQR